VLAHAGGFKAKHFFDDEVLWHRLESRTPQRAAVEMGKVIGVEVHRVLRVCFNAQWI
jgi:hypothetical protein